MEKKDIFELLVTSGPLKDQRFAVSSSGIRLGRSSSCEIAIKDPALSRNHCLIELREGKLWITDLASANGTYVNEAELGAEPVALNNGDRILVGESELTVISPDAEKPAPQAAPLDLGLTGTPEANDDEFFDEDEEAQPNLPRMILWAVAGLMVVGAAWMILTTPTTPEDAAPEQKVPQAQVAPVVAAAEKPTNAGEFLSLAFEKVQAGPKGVCRLAIAFKQDGTLQAVLDDVPQANRHLTKETVLSKEKQTHLADFFADAALYALAPTYVGEPLHKGELQSMHLRVVRTSCVFDVMVANEPEPEVLTEIRERLEAFVKDELGIWGMDKTADELRTLSAEAKKRADAFSEERDVEYGNLSRALAAYDEAVALLQTVDPKPDFFSELVQRQRGVRDELNKRYKDQCFRVDKAVNMKDWKAALVEARVLRDLVPDSRDPRHAEANAKLLEIEARQKGNK